ncbi:hypothetical protein [Azospirillum brasilense]|uniref:hypothetical protein n=1 Tax=Azospirillum brasilense TaxID=192 RepID=UPI000E677B61|nr:hypothetical protein [Azospirillum brasilense]NUB23347.1 hypothetical protein [Azospirillum brasilense]NUB30969.1 hypothetical protein [Azospirillum brasilense]RIW05650.1 hypothetical protein D2T81_07335 [Azospirillum brasilense]
MDSKRYYVDLYRNKNYESDEGELEAKPFLIGAILRDDSDSPLYTRRRLKDLGEAAEVGYIGLGRRWRMQGGERVGNPVSMVVGIEIYGVGTAVFEADKRIDVDADGKTVRVWWGRGKMEGGRSVDFEFHPKTEGESGAWHPAFVNIGPAVFNPFVGPAVFPPGEPEQLTAEEFFPYDN